MEYRNLRIRIGSLYFFDSLIILKFHYSNSFHGRHVGI